MSGSLRPLKRRQLPADSSDPRARSHLEEVVTELTCLLITDSSKGLQRLHTVLTDSGLPPETLIGERKPLGQGSQFNVYEQLMYVQNSNGFTQRYVAVKQPRFLLTDSDVLNLSAVKVKNNVEDLCVEIYALSNPKLRSHPNIVTILGWSYDEEDWHHAPLLLVELAAYDLFRYLQMEPEVNEKERFEICLDIAAGLDALHGSDLVHGDLKPQNVLICWSDRQDGVIAKLSDFGLSAEVTDDSRMGGTSGWLAPEIQEGRRIEAHSLSKTDIYSYGLLAWSVALLRGETPPRSTDQRQQAVSALNTYAPSLPSYFFESLRQTLMASLEVEPSERLSSAISSWKTEKEFISWSESRGFQERMSSFELDVTEMKAMSIDLDHDQNESENTLRWAWEILPSNRYLAQHNFEVCLKQKDAFAPWVLFGIFLSMSIGNQGSKFEYQRLLDLVHQAAIKGYEPAQGVLCSVYEFYGLLPPGGKQEYEVWTIFKVTPPSAFGHSLAQLDALSEFQREGGYNRFYSPKLHAAFKVQRSNPGASLLAKALRELGLSKLVWSVVYGSIEDVQVELNNSFEDLRASQSEDVDAVPLLQYACRRGSISITKLLLKTLSHSESIVPGSRLTCLHWLFAFDPVDQETMAEELKIHGSPVDGIVTGEVSFMQWPFILPVGTPLHWAVVMRNHSMISALLKVGADPNCRNASDPYRFDSEVRVLDKIGGQDQLAYSTPNRPTLGLSPLDLAAASWDSFLFEEIGRLNIIVKIDDVDEEGFTPLHRLCQDTERHSGLSTLYDDKIFRGSLEFQRKSIHATVSAIIGLGASIDKLSTPSYTPKDKKPMFVDGQTPLMLAVVSDNLEIVTALLAHGADASVGNRSGQVPLLCLIDTSKDRKHSLQICKLLIDHGANVLAMSLNGTTPLINAARREELETVKLFLEHGARVDTRFNKGRGTPDHDKSFWAYICRPYWMDIKSQETQRLDRETAALISTFLLSHQDIKTRKDVLNRADGDGMSLLYHFVSNLMPQCVATLLQSSDVDVNALRYRYKTDKEKDRKKVKVSWQETALDKLKASSKWYAENMRLRYSERVNIEEVCQEIFALLLSKKCTAHATESEVRKPYPETTNGKDPWPEGKMAEWLYDY